MSHILYFEFLLCNVLHGVRNSIGGSFLEDIVNIAIPNKLYLLYLMNPSSPIIL